MAERRLLCVYQHAPTPGAPGIYRHRQLFAELVRRGWAVDLVSTPRNYMTGEVPFEYRRKPYVREEIEGVVHHWVWSTGRIHENRRRRAMNYGSFAVAATLRASLLSRPTVIMVSSPPLSVGSIGPVLGARFRRPWVLDVRDVWPESAAAVGWLSQDSRLFRALSREAGRLTRGAAAVTMQSPGLMSHVLRRGAASACVVPGVLVDSAHDPGARARVRRTLQITEGTCLFVYIGSVGVANAVGMLVDAVEALPAELDVRFAVVGAGSAMQELQEKVALAGSKRVSLQGAVAKEHVADYLAAADVCLHSLRSDGVFAYSFPSKILEYFGAHKPFVTTASGYPERLARRSGGGFASGRSDLVQELARWVAMAPTKRLMLGERAHAFGAARFGIEGVVDRLESVLLGVSADSTGTKLRSGGSERVRY